MKTLICASLLWGGALAAEAGIAWRRDYGAALVQAQKHRRLLVVHFWLEGRPLVQAMSAETFAHPEVVKVSNEKFINVKVDINARPELFEKTVGGRGGLATCVLDAGGDVVSVLPGYADAPAYLQFLTKAEKGYEKLKAARAAAGRSPKDVGALCRLAQAYEDLGSLRRAEEEFENVIRLGSQRPAGDAVRFVCLSHERVARLCALRGKNLDARKHVAAYRQADPDNHLGRLDRILITEALIFWIERRFSDSVRALEEGMRRFPSSAERDRMLLAMGVVLHESGNDPKALEALEKLLKEFPVSPILSQAREQIAHIKNPPPDHQH
jgi:tetratricopeptide (TPR) repeat protein